MKKGFKMLSLFLVGAITLSAGLAGCGKDTASESANSTAVADSTKSSGVENPEGKKLAKATIKVYGITWGNLNADNKVVMDEVNKLLMEKINATIDYTIDLAADAEKKVPLMLASGEEYDGITMTNALFQAEVSKGGIQEIEDMLKEYMPKRMEGASDYDLKDVTYNGKLYGIPGGFQLFAPQGWIIRGDLREKYNIPEVKDLESLKTYLQILKEKEPDVIPFNTSAADTYTLNQTYIEGNGYIGITGPLYYQYNSDKVTAIYNYEMSEYKDFLNLTKEFSDKGYWSKNAYASKANSLDGFKNGVSYVGTGHCVSANDTSIQLKTSHPDWKVEYVRIPNNFRDRPSKGLAYTIPQTAKNPERLMMALELIQNDEEINALMEYGIKDVHYTLTSEGKVKATEQGVKNFPPDQFPLIWNNRNVDLYKVVDGSVTNFMDFQKEEKVKEYSVINKLAGFILNKENIVNEIAAITEVTNTYAPITKLGAFASSEKILKEYADKMKAAGAEKVKAEVQKQIDEFLASKNK